MEDKAQLISALRRISQLYEQRADKGRSLAFARAANSLQFYSDEEIPDQAKLLALPDIGPAIAKCVDQWRKTGQIDRLTQLEQPVTIQPPIIRPKFIIQSPISLVKRPVKFIVQPLVNREEVIKLFLTIIGVGQKTAEDWYNMGWRSMAEVNNHQSQLTTAQKIGLRYREVLQQRIPRAEIEQFESRIKSLFTVKWLICGSYRRGQSDSGDVDILIQQSPETDLATIVERIKSERIILEKLSLGPKKFMGIAQLIPDGLPRRLDIFWLPARVWPYAMLHFTGSGQHNVKLRRRAIEKGWKLSEYSLTNEYTQEITCQNEADIFARLDLDYVEPKDRS